ncbi:zinc-binding alcohol dehydrogenase family protein [Streptomyces sp. NPDC057621]|uniref:quinone oxidoreductase family protein n=1 Tax=Streptomyces sp. NPDC057621 TaxID=3346186 RepID=UPI0036C6DEAD
MRAAVLSAPGVPEPADFRDPEPTAEAAVVDVLAAPINNFDKALASGRHPLSPAAYPAVAGYDGVGRTADGRLVYFEAPVAPFGSMAERTLVDEARLIELPEGTDPAVAAVLGNAGAAGWLPLSWRAEVAAGETVAVLGAAGVVGSIALQAALQLGVRDVVAIVRGDRQVELAHALGATATVDTAQHKTFDGLVAAMRKAAPDGFNVVIDYLWGATVAAAVDNAAVGARVVHVGAVTGDISEIPGAVLRTRGIDIRGFAGYLVPRDIRVQAYLHQVALATQQRLQIAVAPAPLEDLAAAWSHSPSTARTVVSP